MSHPTKLETVCEVRIDGMTCHSCELLIERSWKQLPGVKRVDVRASKGTARITGDGRVPSIAELQSALAGHSYHVRSASEPQEPVRRPSFWRLVGLFALVLLVLSVLSSIGLTKTGMTFSSSTGFWSVFVIGLVAASSSCIAISGGLLLSSVAAFNRKYASATPSAKMRPVAFFVGGRIASYTFFGGLIGALGKALSPPPIVTGGIAIAAAIFMFIMGLEMLQLVPAWAKRLLPGMPKRLSHRILDAGQSDHWAAPVLLGGATFFLPCGFTQALQLYALTTGSFSRSALLLFAFALGTAPALLALGWASGSLKGKVGTFFFQFSGALVVVLGLWNMQNGLAITGHPLSWPAPATQAAVGGMSSANGVSFDGQTQVLNMAVGYAGYVPNRFTIRAGVPTRWQIDGTNAAGCATVIQSPALGIGQKLLTSGINTIQFTAPSAPGVYPFSCSMGMYRGTITVVSS